MAEVYENYFFTWHLTDEDKAKTMQYQQERERRKERESAVSYEDYLRSLQTTIRLAPVNDNTRERAVQLMNKTNQFNTCTLRMDELALEHYLGEEGGHLLMAEVSDKYGNSGWVSEFLYHQDGDTAVIDNFLMSCSVSGSEVSFRSYCFCSSSPETCVNPRCSHNASTGLFFAVFLYAAVALVIPSA